MQKLETEVEKFREAKASLKRESQLLKDKCGKERKCYTTRIEELCEELKRRTEELEETRRFQREQETTLEAKEEEICQIR